MIRRIFLSVLCLIWLTACAADTPTPALTQSAAWQEDNASIVLSLPENWTWNVSWFADPVFLGHYPEEGLLKFKDYLPEITQEDMELIHQPIDFMGQNIYNGYYIRMGADGKPEYVDRPAGFSKTAANPAAVSFSR